MAAQLAGPFGMLVLLLLVQRLDSPPGLGDNIVTLELVPLGLIRVPDEEEPAAGGAFGIQEHVLDLKTIVQLRELPFLAEGGMGVGIPAQPQLLANDVMITSSPEDPAVLLGIEPGILHKDGPAKLPQVQITLDLFYNRLVTGISRPGPTLYRNTTACDGKADDDLGELRMVVLAVLAPFPVSQMHRLFTGFIRLDEIGILPFDLEVGGGGVDEQQVDFQVEQIGDRMEDGLLQHIRVLLQEVHRTVQVLRIH